MSTIKVSKIVRENDRIKLVITESTELLEGYKFFNSSEDDGTISLHLLSKDGEAVLELDESAKNNAINLVRLFRKKSFYIVGKDGEGEAVKVSLTDKGVANLRESVQKAYGLEDDPQIRKLKRLNEARSVEALSEQVKPSVERGSLTELMRRRAGME